MVDEEQNCWIIDAGDFSDITKIVQGKRIHGILLTHAHFDHIYGLPDMQAAYPNVPIYTNTHGVEALKDPFSNLSFYHGTPLVVQNMDNIRLVNNQISIANIEGSQILPIFTPGHHPSCITWEIGQYLFTGDSYIPGYRTVTKLLHGCKETAVLSETIIKSRASQKIICAGHPGKLSGSKKCRKEKS